MKRLKSIRRSEVDKYFPFFIQAAWFTDRQPAAQNAAPQYEQAAATEAAKARAKDLRALADFVREKEVPVASRPVYVPPGPISVDRFAEFQCNEGEWKVIVEVGGERREYRLDDPLNVIIEGWAKGRRWI